MKNIWRRLSSPALALILLLAFALAMAIATFVENDFGTSVAWQLIYDSWWFEAIMFGLGVSFILNIKKYQLFQKRKWPVLVFHIAFIIILIGAAITRYYSFTGVMRVREGESSNVLISSENSLKGRFSVASEDLEFNELLDFNTLSSNDFQYQFQLDNVPIEINYRDFIADAVPQVVSDEQDGTDLLELVLSDGSGRTNLFLKKDEVKTISEGNILVFDKQSLAAVNIWEEEGVLKIKSAYDVSTFEMATEVAGIIPRDSIMQLKYRTLYRFGDVSFVPLMWHKMSKVTLVSGSDKPKDNDETKEDALLIDVTVGKAVKTYTLPYNEGLIPLIISDTLNGVNLNLSYGSELKTLPFRIKLYDFQLERYPGSTSPSSYASEVAVEDGEFSYGYRIYMNNVLDHKGYRFFQASYDTDEKGTVLAVNYDVLGTNVTYLGYFLMMLGMFFTLLGKGSRFTLVNKKLKALKSKVLVFVVLLCSSVVIAQSHGNAVPKVMVSSNESTIYLFSRLMVQDLDGRIKPVHTLASEILRKVHGKPYYKLLNEGGLVKLNPSDVFLRMMASPQIWESMPIIKINQVKMGHLLDGVKIHDNDCAAFNQLIDAQGRYILARDVEVANKKLPAERNEQDKELIKVDERFNILYNVFVGNYFTAFPNGNDANNKWYSYTHDFTNFPAEDVRFALEIMPQVFRDISANDWESAFKKLEYVKTFQDILGEEVMPTNKHLEAEILYNDLNLNFWMFQALFTLGGLLLVMALLRIFYNAHGLRLSWNLVILLTLLCAIIFSLNLCLRWYVAGHAPWSNGYEMLVFVAWVLLLCGFLTFRKSDFALPLATLFSGALLFVSYLDWLNPEITNLMPVLKSFWLKVHVATIVSSYAPLALSAILGLMALILIILRTSQTAEVLTIKIKELTLINEISMTIGLFVLSVGTFLGGIWANESWGRYWAWDPKETWALISIIVYAIVLHLRFVPKLNTNYALNVASVLAFSSIIMTSFGVNYYLSGLHSYAAGDPMPIPTFVYYVVAIVGVIIVMALYKTKSSLSSN